jgi:indole-3-glycerol phosphate synthase
LKKAREINAAEKKQKKAEAEMKLQQQLEAVRVTAEKKQKVAEEAMNMAPGPEKRSKGKTPGTKEDASPEKANAEQIRNVRIAWIATLTEEELWQIMLTVVRNLESCVAAPI